MARRSTTHKPAGTHKRRPSARPPRTSHRRRRRDRNSAERVAKRLQRQPRDEDVPRPSWRRYWQAYSRLLEDGQPVTETAIARELGISRVSLWRIHRRNPGLRRWVAEQCRSRNEHLISPVIYMLGATAMRTKSPKHAELFLRATGSLDFRDEHDTEGPAAGGFTMNFLVPRPETPIIPGVTVREVHAPQLAQSAGANPSGVERSGSPEPVPFVKIR
jgi:hypothetical protein